MLATYSDLKGKKVLDCPSGASSFVQTLKQNSIFAKSVDIIYEFSKNEIERQGIKTLEKIYQKSILDVWNDLKSRYYPTTTLGFHVENKTDIPKAQFAPTEDCAWRKKIMRAEVHDENTWSFGGVSSHAGLFGSIEDVSAVGLNLRSQLQGIARYNIRQKTAQLFATRAIPSEVGDWALGYMMPSLQSPSCGPHFSIFSIGHTGFTGTSMWYDPRHDLLVIVLSNRIHYGRDNKAFIQLRPQIHSWIFESLKRTV